jgi:predicted nucleic acid-binding Zn ribbon protein
MPFQYICETCGGTFTRAQRRTPRNPYRYCSWLCRPGPRQYRCETCGTPFTSENQNPRFCSQSCRRLPPDVKRDRKRQRHKRFLVHRDESGLCIRCGKPGTPGERGGRSLCEHHRNLRRNVYERERTRGSGARQIKVRIAALRVYGCACAQCGFSHPAALQFHHIAGERGPLENRTSSSRLYSEIARNGQQNGVVLLCANCHVIRHKSHLYPDLAE